MKPNFYFKDHDYFTVMMLTLVLLKSNGKNAHEVALRLLLFFRSACAPNKKKIGAPSNQ